MNTTKLISKLSQLLPPLIPQSELPRERWVAKQLTAIPAGKKILDAGAGECYYRRYCDHLVYISQDFNKYTGRGDEKGIQTGTRDTTKIDIVSDITKIPLPTASFDTVLCVEVLEHLPRPLDALKELSRVLKKGGTFILTAPFTSLTHYSPFFYHSGFSRNFYTENLPKLGFTIEEMYTYGNYFSYLALELVRTPLVCLRSKRPLAILFLIFYPLVLPAYFLLRLWESLLPQSQELLSFSWCIKARKK